jgi:hypothetical protein
VLVPQRIPRQRSRRPGGPNCVANCRAAHNVVLLGIPTESRNREIAKTTSSMRTLPPWCSFRLQDRFANRAAAAAHAPYEPSLRTTRIGGCSVSCSTGCARSVARQPSQDSLGQRMPPAESLQVNPRQQLRRPGVERRGGPRCSARKSHQSRSRRSANALTWMDSS